MTSLQFFVNCTFPPDSFNYSGTEKSVLKSLASENDNHKSVEIKAFLFVIISVLINVVLHFSYCKRPETSRFFTRIFDVKTAKRTATLIGLVLSLPIVTMLLAFALCYKVLCTAIIWRKDKYFVGLLDSFDVFWSLEEEATINVLGTVESDSPEALVLSIKGKLEGIVTQAGVDKIFYRRNEEYGFYYWRRYSSIDVSQYVELLEITEKENLSLLDLEDIMSEVSCQMLPYNNEGLFKIFVTKNRVGNYDEERGEYGIIFIIHHSVGDGVALLEFLCKTFADNTKNYPVNMFSVPEAKCYDSPRTLLNMIQKLCELPLCFVETILRKPDDNALHGPPLIGEKSFKWTESDENLMLMVKEIKDNVRDATFSDILAFALSGGMHDYYTKTRGHVPEDLGVILPVRFPKSSNFRCGRVDLKNDFSVTILNLPISNKRNLSDIKARCDELRESVDPLSNHYFIKLVSILPNQILKPMMYSNQATLVFSNMPGPNFVTLCGGNALKKLVFFVPHKGNTGLDVTALSYGGVLRFAASADKAIISDSEHLSYILDGMVDEIKRLHLFFVDRTE